MMRSGLGDRISTTLLLLVVTLAVTVTGVLSRIDNVLYDTAQQLTDPAIPTDVVIVTIDEQSLASLGRWPWSRRVHAQLIENLHADGALAIGVDIMFTEPQKDDPDADRLLAQAMARAGNVVLPVVLEEVRHNGQLIETLPLPSLTAQAAALGRIHAELDADTIARSISLWEGIAQPIWPHFAQAILTVADQVPDNLVKASPPNHQQVTEKLVRRDQRYINFTTSQRHLPSLSFAQVLRGEYQEGTFRGKLVLIGATASGMADSLPTPVSGFKQPMPGVEFLGNTIISMREQTLVSLAPRWLIYFFSCAVAIMPMLWLPYVRTSTGLLLNMTFAALVIAGAMALPRLFFIWLPMSAGVFGVLSTYPLWAWRKLESASQFLDAELARLQHALGTNFTPSKRTTPSASVRASDPFHHRIDQVRAATNQLQQLEQTHKEALAFISHDIRVPLASAAAQIQQALGDHHPAHKQLLRSLAWTEDFLQTSRAQMLKPEEFAELNVIDLLHEVIDDIYPLTKASSVNLSVSLPNTPIWIYGNFDTLLRALSNVLSNALKFSTKGGQISLATLLIENQINISITDTGKGINPQDLDNIFKRFSQIKNDTTKNHQGVGLGLYFVETVIKKHNGNITISSEPGNTKFQIYLPILPKK